MHLGRAKAELPADLIRRDLTPGSEEVADSYQEEITDQLLVLNEPERPKKRLESEKGCQQHQEDFRRQNIYGRPVTGLVQYPN
ncbi:MAG TPA: hypothetical protein HA349_11660 [Methanotrichaceae archaeon]|nr:hypothetical protein [Methanotrichaceae archaeon]